MHPASRPAAAPVRALAGLLLATALVGAPSAAVAADPAPAVDPAAGWADLPLSGRTVLHVGHVDLRSTVSDGALRVEVHDDATSPATVHEVAEVTLAVAPGARVTGPALEPVLGPGVDEAWVLPQSQDFALLWPGWDVEPSGSAVTWTLDAVRGPGRFALVEHGGLGQVRTLLDGSDAARSFSYREHGHGSWVFSRPGVYCLDSTFSAGDAADAVTLLLAVGDVDPERVTSLMCGLTPEQIVAGDQRPGTAPTPLAPDALTGDARGDVRAAAAGLTTTGGVLDVQVGPAQAGRWVSLWWYSAPQDLGWHRVASDGWLRGIAVPTTTAGEHRVAALDRTGALIGWAPVAVAAPAPEPTPTPAPVPAPAPAAPAAEQQVCTPTAITRQVRAEDVTVVTHGHLDLGAQLVDGALVARVKDDAHVWQDPAALVLHVSDDARTTVPAGYGFLGAPGSTVWTIAEAQQPTVPWLGWNTQHPTVTAGTSGPVTFALTAVDGPGDLVVTMNGTLGGAPRRVFDTVGGPRSTAVPLSAHQHASWSFTRPGVYHVTLTQTTTTTAGRQVSAAAVLHLLVGPGDPRTAAASSTVTEWVGRTATGEACALTADQVPAGTGARTVDHRIPRAAAQVTAAAAVLAPVTSIVPAPSERVADAPAAPVPTVDPAGTGAGGAPAVLGGLAGLALVGAAATGRAWWRDQTQEDPR